MANGDHKWHVGYETVGMYSKARVPNDAQEHAYMGGLDKSDRSG